MRQSLENRIQQLENQIRVKNQTLSALGQKPNESGVIKDFYVYEEDFFTLVAGASKTGSVNVQADSDFVLQKLTYSADINGGAVTDSSRVIPLVTVQITDTGSGRNVMETAVPVTNVFGSGEIPFILPQPKLFLARSTISISVANYSSNTTYNLRLSLIGHKIFRL